MPKEKLSSIEFEDYDQTTKRFEVVKSLIQSGKDLSLLSQLKPKG